MNFNEELFNEIKEVLLSNGLTIEMEVSDEVDELILEISHDSFDGEITVRQRNEVIADLQKKDAIDTVIFNTHQLIIYI